MSRYSIALVILLIGALIPQANGQQLDKIKLPPGFEISVYARNVPNARSMVLSPAGTLFVGTRDAGNVYAILNRDEDSKADEVITIARGLNMPNGVALRDGSLYVAEVNRVLRYDNIEADLQNPPKPVVVNDGFPSDRSHGWKFIRFGPDGMLYVPVGGPCNVCLRDDERYSTIMRMRPDGTELEVFAHGIRNTVGFDWHPETRELWFTDNGRDWLGDDMPPDELNHAPNLGMHFGFPYCHGGDIPDPEFGKQRNCEEFTPPAIRLGPHVAALGMRFYTGSMFPTEYQNQIFIAEHGSWNRSVPIGYRVTLVRLEGNRAVSYEVFAEGWLQGNSAWGRPVDVLIMPDGALLVSDDQAGMIYRIHYRGADESVVPHGKQESLWGKLKKGKLLPNYPNPFNPETWIPYLLAEPAYVEIRIYNTMGQLVRRLDMEQQNAGAYVGRSRAAYWDGRNSAGERVASGTYFYAVKAGSFAATRRMELIQ
jgi:glucose/arabinose dehydrogenase